jgi:general secretion pathway protein D
VGVNLDITPTVHQNDEITLKVRVEVSAVTSTAQPVPGVNQPVIGQRVIDHDIRLRDGEINILGGIMQTQDTHGVSGIPGLSQIPLLKYLFSNVSDTLAQDEVLIVLRPHTIRLPDITPFNLRPLDIGTEGAQSLHEPSEVPLPGAQPPATVPQAAAPAAVPAPAAPQAAPAAPAGPTASNGAAVPAATPAVAEVARLRVADNPPSPQSGEIFEVPVQIENARDVFSVPLELQYDSAALKLLDVKKGDFWSADGQPVAVVERPLEEEGKTEVTLSRPPGSGGVSGSGTLAVFRFQAAHSGNTSLGIIPDGARSTASYLPVQGVQTAVNIQ